MASTVSRSYMDSFEKIVSVYFQSVVREEFTYAGKTYYPKPLRLSPSIFRSFKCHKFCGACCRKFSLEYLPKEVTPYPMTQRVVTINGVDRTLIHDDQSTTTTHHCKHVDMQTGWCGVHTNRPLSCDFELLRFIMPNPALDPDNSRRINLGHQPFGRSWTMTQIDGTKGTKCEFGTPTDESLSDAVRKLKRLQEWTDHFELKTCIPIMIKWVSTGPHTQPLVIPKDISSCEEMDSLVAADSKKVIASTRVQPLGFFR